MTDVRGKNDFCQKVCGGSEVGFCNVITPPPVLKTEGDGHLMDAGGCKKGQRRRRVTTLGKIIKVPVSHGNNQPGNPVVLSQLDGVDGAADGTNRGGERICLVQVRTQGVFVFVFTMERRSWRLKTDRKDFVIAGIEWRQNGKGKSRQNNPGAKPDGQRMMSDHGAKRPIGGL